MTRNTLAEYPDVLSPEDVQKILGIGRNAVYRLLTDGTIKSLKVGRRYLIPKLYLLEYMYPEFNFEKEMMNYGTA